MRKLIKNIFRNFGIEVKRYIQNNKDNATIALKTVKEYKGNVLLSYDISPFILKNGEYFDTTHISDWHCFRIAQTFLEFGYNVDVINYNDYRFTPYNNYAFFVDVLSNMERIASLLNKDCIKIYNPLFAHWLFHNSAEYQRYTSLQRRRSIVLKPTRLLPPNLSAENADYIIVLGNKFTVATYMYAQKPIYRIPNTCTVVHTWPEEKDYENCKKKFLWLGGNGLVHKGLDLVLDAFSEMPDYHMYICGPIRKKDDLGQVYDRGIYQAPKEEEFESAYHNELYETSNIHTIGWIDVSSSEFIEVVNKCIGVVHPSCSEGGSAVSVINCMYAGLIPIVSYESGVDVDDSFGVILKDCSIDTIKNTVKMISHLPAEKLRQMSRKAWEFARANHAREQFAEEYKKLITKIIQNQSLWKQ